MTIGNSMLGDSSRSGAQGIKEASGPALGIGAQRLLCCQASMWLPISTYFVQPLSSEVLVLPGRAQQKYGLPWSVPLVGARVTACIAQGTGCVPPLWIFWGNPGSCNNPSCATCLWQKNFKTGDGPYLGGSPSSNAPSDTSMSLSTFFRPFTIPCGTEENAPICLWVLPQLMLLKSPHTNRFLWSQSVPH